MNKKQILRFGFLVSFLIQILFWANCSSTPIDESNPEALFKDAESEIKSDHYQIALDKLRIVKNKFPYSKFAIEAQLKIADVYFMQESFGEAAISYESFRDLHPKHEKTAYAMFRIGKSYFNDIPSTIARDLTTASKARAAYNEFIEKFPNSPDVPEAKKDTFEILGLLADKELSIGDFYYKRGFYSSAQPRYKKVVELFPGTEASKKAQEKIEKIDARKKAEEFSHDGSDAHP